MLLLRQQTVSWHHCEARVQNPGASRKSSQIRTNPNAYKWKPLDPTETLPPTLRNALPALRSLELYIHPHPFARILQRKGDQNGCSLEVTELSDYRESLFMVSSVPLKHPRIVSLHISHFGIHNIPLYAIQVVSGGKVNSLGGHSISHSKLESIYICTCVLFRTVSEIQLSHCTVHCTDEEHAMSSHDLQSALMSTVEFSKMY
jgi:hypothetical protein